MEVGLYALAILSFCVLVYSAITDKGNDKGDIEKIVKTILVHSITEIDTVLEKYRL